MLSSQAIEEYKELYRKRFGVVLTDAEASFRANNLLNFYKAVLAIKPLQPEEVVNKIPSNNQADDKD